MLLSPALGLAPAFPGCHMRWLSAPPPPRHLVSLCPPHFPSALTLLRMDGHPLPAAAFSPPWIFVLCSCCSFALISWSFLMEEVRSCAPRTVSIHGPRCVSPWWIGWLACCSADWPVPVLHLTEAVAISALLICAGEGRPLKWLSLLLPSVTYPQ